MVKRFEVENEEHVELILSKNIKDEILTGKIVLQNNELAYQEIETNNYIQSINQINDKNLIQKTINQFSILANECSMAMI